MTALDYQPASPGPSGPLRFRPSLRTLALLLLTAACTAWVFARHEPWMRVGDLELYLPLPRFPCAAFTPDNRLLAVGLDRVLRVHEPATGRPLRDLYHLSDEMSSVTFLQGGAQVLVIDWDQRRGIVLDSATGAVVRTTPDLSWHQNLRVNDAGSRAIGVRPSAAHGRAPAVVLLDISAGAPPDGRPVVVSAPSTAYRLLRGGALCELTPRRPLFQAPIRGPSKIIRIDDLATVATSGWIERGPDRGPCVVAITDHHRLVASLPGDRTRPSVVPLEVRDLDTDRLLGTFTIPWHAEGTGSMVEWTDLVARSSDDGQRIFVMTVATEWGCDHSTLIDLASRRAVPIGPVHPSSVCFFPGSKWLVEHSRLQGTTAVVAWPGGAVLAPLDSFGGNLTVSPNGQFLLDDVGELARLFRRPGPECRMSRLGLIGMPHVWLLIAAFAGLTLSLASDARRRRPAGAAALPRAAALALGSAAVLGSLALLLAAALGQRPWFLVPAPLVLVALILSQTGSRFGRLVLLVTCAASAAWCLEHARRALPAGLAGWSVRQVLDRRYPLPDAAVVAAWSAAAALALVVILLLTLRRHPRKMLLDSRRDPSLV